MIRWTAGAQNTRDESTKFATLQDAITAVGSNNATLYILAGTYNISADLTVPANVTLNLERGAVLAVATTKTLTINGLIEAGFYQVFSWTGTGAIVLSGLQPVKTSWFGDTAAGINKALLSVSRPCVFKMPGKYIDLGTTSIEIYTCGHTLQGQGVDFSGNHYHGTRLDYSGSGYAILVGKAGVFSAKIGLKDFGVYKTGAGSKGIRMGLADPDWIRYPYMENVVVMDSGWQGSHGMDVLGSEYGIYRRCEFSYNGGAGVRFAVNPANLEGGNINVFESCSFSYNKNEGVLVQRGEDLRFFSCDLQGNGYEGLKATSIGARFIDNLVVESCWFEGNQVDAGRTNGYYHILSADSYVGRITLRHNSLRGITNLWNGTTGNKMACLIAKEATSQANSYCSMSKGAAVQIEALTRANPCQVTWTGHGLSTSDNVLFYNVTQAGWGVRLSSVEFKITKIDDNNFTIPCDTIPCAADYDPNTDPGTVRKINVPRPWNYALGGVIRLIGEDIDKWSFHQNTRVEGDFAGWDYADYYVRTTRTTVEETLYSHIFWGKTLAGNSSIIDDAISEGARFMKGGRLSRLKIRAEGTKTGSAGNKTIKLYWGSQVIGTVGPTNDDNTWMIEATVKFTDATAQQIISTAWNQSTPTLLRTAGSQNAANDVEVKITGTAAGAGDTITCHALSIIPDG